MSNNFNASIRVFCEKHDDITVDECFHELYKTARCVENLTCINQDWYMTGYSFKDALKHPVFDGENPSRYALNEFTKNLDKNGKVIIKSIWNGKPDGEACSITHAMMFRSNLEKVHIFVEIEQQVASCDVMIDSLVKLTMDKRKAWITVDSKLYSIKRRSVFPDRIPCGWMLYIPTIVLPELIPEAARVVPVLNEEGKQKGTIIVSTEEIFDGSKKEHIEKSNDIEIRLLDLGLLPLMTEL